MSQTDELLNGLTDEEIQTYSSDPETEPHIVIGVDRNITVPEELKKIGVQYDHNIETLTFDCIRYWDNHDLSEMALYINYMRSDGEMGSYLVTDVTIDEDDSTMIHFTWTISGHVTYSQGNVTVLVCAKKTNEEGIEIRHWNSEINNEMYVSKGMESVASVVEQNSDIVTQLLIRMDTAEKAVYTTDVTAALRQYEETQTMIKNAKTDHTTFLASAEAAKKDIIDAGNAKYDDLVSRVSMGLTKVEKEFNGTYPISGEHTYYGTVTVDGKVSSNGVHGMLYIYDITFNNVLFDNTIEDCEVNLVTVDDNQKPFDTVYFEREYNRPEIGNVVILTFAMDTNGKLTLSMRVLDPSLTPKVAFTATDIVEMYPLDVRYGISCASAVNFSIDGFDQSGEYAAYVGESWSTYLTRIQPAGHRGPVPVNGIGLVAGNYTIEKYDADGAVIHVSYPNGFAVSPRDTILPIDYICVTAQ